MAAATPAVSTWTLTDVPDDTETCTIGAKVYTFQASLTNVNGNVKILGTIALTLAAFAIAINEGGSGSGAGTNFAAAMTRNELVTAEQVGDTLVITARVPGIGGNEIRTSDTHGEGTWTSTVCAGGTGSAAVDLKVARDEFQANSAVYQLLDALIGHEE